MSETEVLGELVKGNPTAAVSEDMLRLEEGTRGSSEKCESEAIDNILCHQIFKQPTYTQPTARCPGQPGIQFLDRCSSHSNACLSSAPHRHTRACQEYGSEHFSVSG